MKISYQSKTVARLTSAIAIFFALSFAAFAQNKDFPNFKTMPTGKGIMLTSRNSTPDFAVLIEGGSEPELDANDGGLRIKTAVGEVVVYRIDTKLYAKTPDETPEMLIKNYRAALLAAQPIEVAPNEKIAVDTELNGLLPVFDLRNGKDEKSAVYASSWSRPISGANGARRVYLSFVIGDSILTLRKDMPDDSDEQNAPLIGALNTLTLLPPQKIVAPPTQKQPIKKKIPAQKPKRKS